jgi:enterochelin esterase-like enzyme
VLGVLTVGALALALTPAAASAHDPSNGGSANQGGHGSADTSHQVGASNSFSPQVKHTGIGPTGYTVTFRFQDPTATRVQVKGEWYFSSPGQTSTTSSQGLTPAQWQPGDFPIASPNSTAANWPVTDLTLDAKTGVWSYTTPMPSGLFTYGFFVNCATPTGAGCAEVSDPHNAPWNSAAGVSTGSVEPTSQVYVPADRKFGTVDYSWLAPNKRHGNLVDVSYPSPQSTAPVGSHPLAVYTPPGYQARGKTVYPTLYLSHGAGGNEVDWSTQGGAGNILDNLIADHQIQPMVVVMTNFNGLSGGTAGYSTDVVQNVIPYVEAHYNVSKDADDRAFAGLSAGGSRANDLLFNHTAEFGYYSVMSNAGGGATMTPEQATALKATLGIQVGGGLQDPITASTTGEQANLTANGVPFTADMPNGGHEWYVWRILLHDFLTSNAFRATGTTVAETPAGGGAVRLSATVHAATHESAAVTGTVVFSVDGRMVGSAKSDGHGKASWVDTVKLPAGQHTVTAGYQGSALYNASTSTALAFTSKH